MICEFGIGYEILFTFDVLTPIVELAQLTFTCRFNLF